MAEAVALLLDPSDTSRGYIVWDHGAVVAFGGAPPTDAAIMFTDQVNGAQIEDWTTPSGAVTLADGSVIPFGGSAWSEPATHAALPIVVAAHMNPSGVNQGYKMLADGTIIKWGVGTPNPAYEPTTDGVNFVTDWAYEWATGRSIVLRANGSMQSSTGITGSTVVVKPGRNLYRAIAVREWDATPGFWVTDYAGTVYKANGAEDPGTAGPKWYGRDVVRDLAVVDDGTGGDPLTLAVLTSWGGIGRFTISDPPTVAIVAPTGTITDTTRPQLRWSYTDPDGDAQASYHAAIFTAAQAAAIGFDPATSDAVGRWRGTDRTVFAVDPDTDLANGSYKAYVRASDTSGLTSAWDDQTFTVDVTAPAVPTIDATAAGQWSVTLLVAGADEDSTIDVEFTDDPPDEVVRTWTAARDSGALPDEDGEALLTDSEPRLNRRRWYRARARAGDPTVASEWSDENSALVVEDAQWVVSAPLEILDPAAVHLVPPFSWTEPIPAGVQRPPGEAHAIVVRSAAGRQSAQATATIQTFDADAHTALRYLLDGTRPLLLRSPYGEHWFCEATGELSTEMLDGLAPLDDETTEMRHAHQQSVTLVETERP